MAIAGSGILSIGPARPETERSLSRTFGQEETIRFSDYYRGAGLVPDVPANSGIPTSGEMRLTDFYGAVNVQEFTITDIQQFFQSGSVRLVGYRAPAASSNSFGTISSSVSPTIYECYLYTGTILVERVYLGLAGNLVGSPPFDTLTIPIDAGDTRVLSLPGADTISYNSVNDYTQYRWNFSPDAETNWNPGGSRTMQLE